MTFPFVTFTATSSNLNPASVWLELFGRVLSCHSALDGATVHNDVVLRESHLWQRLALCHTDLCVHQVDPGGQTDSVMGNNFHRETCRLSLHDLKHIVIS